MISLSHIDKLDSIKQTTIIYDMKIILKYLSISKRGLTISEIKVKSKMSDARVRPCIVMLNSLDYISISEKIGNTIIYNINNQGEKLLNELEAFNVKEYSF